MEVCFMTNHRVELDGFFFQAKGVIYPIQAGYVHTSHLENGNLVWDWEMALELKTTDIIPANEMTYILYDDHSVFLKTQVIARRKEGGLTVFTLVPYVQNVIAAKDEWCKALKWLSA